MPVYYRFSRAASVSSFTALALLCILGLGPATSQAATVNWNGLVWTENDQFGNTELELSGSNLIVRYTTPSAASGGANGVAFLASNASAFANINTFGTPWVKFSFITNLDAGNSQAGLFINGPGSHDFGSRILLGNYFTNAYTAVQRGPAAEATVGPPPYPAGFPTFPRVDGEEIFITVGQRPDGTIDYIFEADSLNGGNPVAVSSTYFTDNGVTAGWDWDQFELNFRPNAPQGTELVYTSFQYGNDWPAAAALFPLPEPTTGLLMLAGLVLCRRQRRRVMR